jgi:hypothetical protein
VWLDALEELNPETFGVVDVLSLLIANLIEACVRACENRSRLFHQATSILGDLQEQLAPFFPELQDKEQKSLTTGGGGELNLLTFLKFQIKVEGQRKRTKHPRAIPWPISEHFSTQSSASSRAKTLNATCW